MTLTVLGITYVLLKTDINLRLKKIAQARRARLLHHLCGLTLQI